MASGRGLTLGKITTQRVDRIFLTKEKPASTEVETGSGLTRKFQEEIRLEAVTKADVYGVGARIPFVSTIVRFCISLILHVGGDAVDVRAFTERVGVADADDIALDVKVPPSYLVIRKFSVHAVSSFGVQIADTEHSPASAERCVTCQADAVALDLGDFVDGGIDSGVKRLTVSSLIQNAAN